MVGCCVKKQSLPPNPSFCELFHQAHPNHNPFVHCSSKNLRPLPPFSPLPCASSSTPPPARNAFNHVGLPPSIGIGHCDGWLLHQQKISLSPPPMHTTPFPPARKASDHVGLPHLPASRLSSLVVIINLVPFVVKDIVIIKGSQQPTEGPPKPQRLSDDDRPSGHVGLPSPRP